MINRVTYLPWSDLDLMELRIVSSLPQEFKVGGDPSAFFRGRGVHSLPQGVVVFPRLSSGDKVCM